MALTPTERLAHGKTLRSAVPRRAHAAWAPVAERPDPLAVIDATNDDRWPQYLAVRWGRMLASPFAFFRGAASVMAMDLAETPVSGILVQLSGDAHVLNFGVFASRERNLVFGLNDFDETTPGPWEWDIKRLAASAVLASRDIGAPEATARSAARSVARSYREHMAEFAQLGALEIWYTQLDGAVVLPTLSEAARARAIEIIAAARRRTHLQVLAKMSELVDGNFRIVEEPPLVVRVPHSVTGEALEVVLQQWLRAYRATLTPDRRELLDRYRVVDAVRKVVGVGSVGTHSYVLLMHGYHQDDPLFLQVKEARPSALAPYLHAPRARHQGQRVVLGQRLIQPAPDIFLGWGQASRSTACPSSSTSASCET